jgi:CBS domain containing-hemolysin-like protein
VFQPVVVVAAALLQRLSGSSGRSAFVTRDELRELVRESSSRLRAGETRMLEAVFDFGHTSAREVMVPLPEVVSLPESATPEDLREIVRSRSFTRVPVYRDRADHLTGVVNVFDVLYDSRPGPTLKEYVRPLHLVPDTQRIHRILLDLQRRREGMALVVNEFGGCVGVITLSDIVEEIMGELADEHEDAQPALQAFGDGYILDAGLDVDDLNRALGLSLQKDQFDTVAGLLLKRVGRIPKVGEHIRIGNLDFEILATHQYGIRRLKLRERKGPKEGPGDVGS